jgi:nicotinamidase-related amidase
MKPQDQNLHGSAPDDAPVVLLIIDMISDFEFEDSEKIFDDAKQAAGRIAELKKSAKAAGVPVIYVNDNYGRWQSDFNKLVEHCLRDNVRGKSIVELLRPTDDDYFVLKPQSSGFYSTTLDLLLTHLKVQTVVLTGMAGNICILFTANDAHMRGYHVVVPPDCTASNSREENNAALHIIEAALKAQVIPSREINWRELANQA